MFTKRKALLSLAACSTALTAAAISAPIASAAAVGNLCTASSVTPPGFYLGLQWVPDGSQVRITAIPNASQYTLRYNGVTGTVSKYNVKDCH